MGLIKCPECGKEMSDRAEVCMNCGFPIKSYLEENRNELDVQVPENEQIPHFENDENVDNDREFTICRHCGEKNDPNDHYCRRCSLKLYKSNFETAFEDIGDNNKKNSAMSIASAILSIFGCACYIGVIFALFDLVEGKREKKHTWSVFAIIACIAWTIFFIFIGSPGGDDDYSEPSTQIVYETESEEQKPVEDTESKQKDKKHNKVVTAFINDGLDEKVAVKTYNILKKKIGFKDIEYDNKADGADLYYVNADGNSVAITVSDKVYRVFIPESDYVFYEDGKVKLTAKRFGEITYDSSEASAYYIMAQQIVEDFLKNPRGAKFPSQTFNAEAISIAKDGDLVAVKSYVDATNGFGAKVRTEWVVQFTVIDLDSFSCDPNYIKIGDDSAGEYKKMKTK